MGLRVKNNEKYTGQKMKFSIKDFFSKCDQIRSFLQIWSHLLKISSMDNFIFCVVIVEGYKMIWKEIGDRFGVTFTTAITNDAFDNLKIIVKDNGNTAKILV